MNWYETRNLEPLPPRYVSTVDSGNLAASLLALAEGLRTLPEEAAFRWQRFEGLLDALGVLTELVEGIEDPVALERVRRLEEHLDHIRDHITGTRDRPEAWSPLLSTLSEEDWPLLDRLLLELVEAGAASLGSATLRGLRLWTERVRSKFNAMTDEMDTLLPWLLLETQAPLPAGGLAGEAAAAWEALHEALGGIPTLGELPAVCERAAAHLAELRIAVDGSGWPREDAERMLGWCRQMEVGFSRAQARATEVLVQAEEIIGEAEDLFEAMDFAFLYDRQREVFYLGYNVTDERLDSSHYDLLASEARTASLLAIARGQVPQSHWLHLDRPVARVQGARALLSWNGSMFEYLMPELLTRSYPGLLLEQTAQAVIDQQIAYGRRHRVPWGVSESSYYRFDANMNYQYRGFGVPGLGRKRGLEEDLVIAPYASLLALPFRPRAVVENLKALRREGMLGLYGFYESVDYTRGRLPLGQERGIVKSYMVHHHSMSMVALVNYMLDGAMIRRFHASPLVQSVELLLQEQVPVEAPIEEMPERTAGAAVPQRERLSATPWHVAADAPYTEAQILSNGSYSVMVTASGGGYSRWKDLDLTRWRADGTLEDWGTWFYIQDRDSGALHGATRQPVSGPHVAEDVRLSAYAADYRRQVDGVSVRTEITVAPAADVEIRRLTLTNRSGRRRRLLVTSYAEVLLGSQDADRRHPAFSKLFIDSEYLPDLGALLFRRRPRSAQQSPLYLLHGLVLPPEMEPSDLYETDRATFIGRGRTVHAPRALCAEGRGLTNTAGATLDPVMSLGQEVVLEEDETVTIAYLTLAAESRPEAIALARSLHDLAAIEHAFTQAALQSERESRDSGLGTVELRRIQQLFSVLTFPHKALRAPDPTLSANRRGQPGLWPYAISGDYPILLVHIDGPEQIDLVRELLRAHGYLRQRGVLTDLVIVNDRDSGYAQELQDLVQRVITRSSASGWLNQRGGVFTLRGDLLGRPERVLLDAAARAVLWGSRGPLADQLEALRERPARPPLFVPTDTGIAPREELPPVARPEGLLFDNTYGGFRPDGREYVVYVDGERWTPAPWINVVANDEFGFLVSEAGSGYTWAVNSGENRLTPWANDPVSDPPGEALYLRDEESGAIWSPTPLPSGDGAPYLVRHGAGYTVFEHHSHGLEQRLRLFVAPDAPVKIIQLRLRNRRAQGRRVTATYYAAWVLGTSRDISQQYVVPEYDAGSGALLARNSYNEEFGARVAFLAASQGVHGLTSDRTEFLGRLGRLDVPAGLRRLGLSGRVEPGLDPCAALQIHIDLAPGEEQEVYFLLGQGADRHDALRLVERFQDRAAVRDAWRDGIARWEAILSQVQVQTPDPALDVLVNRWLLYQALSCRVWGRSALYQSSGAYGFRDQLQDVMALVHAAPELAREQILRAARHQFEEGDVLHWWHPPSGRGVRTRFADDLLWLPFVTAHYVEATGDESILSAREPCLVGEPLAPDEEERYGLFDVSADEPTIYEHCLRAIRRGDTSGPHALPLFGGGDWNDGMNRVGIEGRGESVWLGWFLYATMTRFAPLAERMGDAEVAAALRGRAHELLIALDAEAWDGEWYLRGYYDDGTPLGSHTSEECQIDAIAQSWSILSGAALREDGGRTAERARQAMSAVLERLVHREERLLLLFTPPFDRTLKDPGYIKGYAPGIRENGGQYTHAAIWTVWAYAELGEGDLAGELYRLINRCTAPTRSRTRRYRGALCHLGGRLRRAAPRRPRRLTWYTGSASWMYRLGVEALLGLRRRGDRLLVNPCIPRDWEGFTVTYRYGAARYDIRVQNPRGVHRGVSEVTLDGVPLADNLVPLHDDGKQHAVHVFLG